MSDKNTFKSKLKLFKPLDALIYGVLAVAIIVLFIVFVFAKKSAPLKAIEVYFNDDVIMTYSFEDDDIKVSELYSSKIEITNTENGYSVSFINIDNDGGVNTIIIDKNAVKVYMKSANCNGNDCVYTDAIKEAGDAIICAPHKLKVKAFSKVTNNINLG